MAVKLVRYRLSINKDCFACIAKAIMVASIEAEKLQGIGQSVRTWLEEWEKGQLRPPSKDDFVDLWQHRRGDPRMVYLALSEQDAARLAQWKTLISGTLKRRASIAMALIALAQAVVERHEKNT